LPTYEYACTACGHRLEAVQKFTDDPLTECPECGGALRKVFGAVGIAFKGSGFYKTDSRAGNGKSGGERKEPAAAESSSSGSATESSSSKESSSSGAATPSSTKEGSSKEAKPAAATAS
jgi:putative FmdB family regulatory protein